MRKCEVTGMKINKKLLNALITFAIVNLLAKRTQQMTRFFL